MRKCLGLVAACLLSGTAYAGSSPNIVYILADDLGYGDVSALNPEGKIPTPNMDRLAKEGMVFTDAHSGSAVCTPTRYGVLTGRYAWRTRLASGVLQGADPPLITAERPTVPKLLKAKGYHTAMVGKWHLGWYWAKQGGGTVSSGDEIEQIDYTKPISGGPIDIGFDYYFGIVASLDMPPYVYVEDNLPTAVADTTKKYIREGPAASSFDAVNVLPDFTAKAIAYLDARAKEPGTPFFLYMPLNSPHTPIVPSEEWQGKSGLNDYGDFTMQTDAAVGEVIAALERNGQLDNTLIIFTSDNGCSPQADYPVLEEKGHDPSYVFRGHKADIFEGGHRIPFLVRWPGRVPAGSESDQTICLTDLLATAAAIVGADVPDNAGEDSVSILPALLGKADAPLREATVHHSINGSFAIRRGNWKLALCPGSGGWSAPRPGRDDESGLPSVQLFDLSKDIGETTNLQDQHPELVKELTALLQGYLDTGRSTPGAPQKNDRDINIAKE